MCCAKCDMEYSKNKAAKYDIPRIFWKSKWCGVRVGVKVKLGVWGADGVWLGVRVWGAVRVSVGWGVW